MNQNEVRFYNNFCNKFYETNARNCYCAQDNESRAAYNSLFFYFYPLILSLLAAFQIPWYKKKYLF